MSYELFIARRLRLNREGRRGLSTSIVIAIAGIALAIMIMMASLCIVLGFKDEIRNKVMGFDSHVTIHPESSDYDEEAYLTLTPELTDIIKRTGEFTSASLVLQQTGVIKTEDNFQAVIVKGIEAGDGFDFVRDNIVEGSLPESDTAENRNKVAVSQTTARALQLHPGDRIYAYFFVDGAVKTRRIEVAAIYDTHFGDYDKLYIFAPLSFTQSICGTDSLSGNRLELKTADTYRINEAAMHLQEAMMDSAENGHLQGMYSISSVLDTAMMYFNWLELLDTNVAVILILMMIVAGFTLISSLFIIILERINMIGILKALGATNGEIRRIFIYMAQKIVIRGMIIGDITGITLLLLQQHYRILPLNPDSYYLNYVPVEINWPYIILLNIGVFVISGLTIIVPSHAVSSISPCRTIRYE